MKVTFPLSSLIHAYPILAHSQRKTFFKYPKKGKEKSVPYKDFAYRVKKKKFILWRKKKKKKSLEVKVQHPKMITKAKLIAGQIWGAWFCKARIKGAI